MAMSPTIVTVLVPLAYHSSFCLFDLGQAETFSECYQVYRDMTGVIAFMILAYSECYESTREILAPKDSIITLTFSFVHLNYYALSEYIEVVYIYGICFV